MKKKMLSLSKKELFFYTIFLTLLCLLLYRCKYGFGDLDESFYLTIPYRIYQGDSLFWDEWNLSLMSSFIQYPLMLLFMFFNKNTDKIILIFRYFYIVFSFISSLIMYKRLKRINYIGSVISSLVLFIYTPFGIQALSYNSMGLTFFILGCVIYITSANKFDYVIVGIMYGLSTLCFPLLSLYYIIFIIFIFITKKQNIKNILLMILGIASIAMIFLFFVFSKISFNIFYKSLKYMLMDKDHSISVYEKIYTYFECFSGYNEYQLKCILPYVLVAFLLLIDKKRNMHKDIYLAITLLIVFNMLIVTYKENHYINFLMYPVSIVAPICLLYCNNINKKLFNYFWIPGCFFTFVVHLCSNQEEYAITGMSIVSTIASIMMLANIFKDISNIKRILYYETLFVLFTLTSFEFQLRWNNVYFDKNIKTQNVLITEGPEKGIYTSQQKVDVYYSYINDINCLEFNGNDVLFLTYDKQWLYLLNNGNFTNSSPSACFPKDVDMILKYYELNPKKIPHNIYADYGKYNDDIAKIIAKKYNMSCYKTALGNYFYKR